MPSNDSTKTVELKAVDFDDTTEPDPFWLDYQPAKNPTNDERVTRVDLPAVTNQ